MQGFTYNGLFLLLLQLSIWILPHHVRSGGELTTCRREEAPAAAAKAGSELLIPTLIRSWKDCDVHLSGIHTGISTRLPSIYCVWQVLRDWLMMTSLGPSRWQSTTPNLSLICNPYIHTHTHLHRLPHPIIWSAPRSHICIPKWCLPPPPLYPVTTNQAPRWLLD